MGFCALSALPYTSENQVWRLEKNEYWCCCLYIFKTESLCGKDTLPRAAGICKTSLISVAMIEHSKQKQREEERRFSWHTLSGHSLPLRDIKAGTQAQNLEIRLIAFPHRMTYGQGTHFTTRYTWQKPWRLLFAGSLIGPYSAGFTTTCQRNGATHRGQTLLCQLIIKTVPLDIPTD